MGTYSRPKAHVNAIYPAHNSCKIDGNITDSHNPIEDQDILAPIEATDNQNGNNDTWSNLALFECINQMRDPEVVAKKYLTTRSTIETLAKQAGTKLPSKKQYEYFEDTKKYLSDCSFDDFTKCDDCDKILETCKNSGVMPALIVHIKTSHASRMII